MSTEDLRVGLRELADDVSLGIEPSRIRRLGRRQRRRRQALAGLAAAALVASGATAIQLSHRTPASTLGQDPSAVTLPTWVRDSVRSEVGDHEVGYGLAERAEGKSSLVLVGLRSPTRDCYAYFVPGDERAGWGSSCTDSETTTPVSGVSLGGGGTGDSSGRDDFVLYGSGPTGTASFALRAPNGRTLAVAGQQAPTVWDNRTYFVVPWVNGATTAQALDRHGAVLACRVLGSDEKC